MLIQVLLYIIYVLLGLFLLLYSIALLKKGNSVYKNNPSERNPMEGKIVSFVEDPNDKENADGVRGHLVAIGNAKPKKSFYISFLKRMIDLIISFCGLIILSPLFAGLAIAIKIDDPGPVFFTQKRVGLNKQYFVGNLLRLSY